MFRYLNFKFLLYKLKTLSLTDHALDDLELNEPHINF